jgi:thiaminase/transcriptional activator TenA
MLDDAHYLNGFGRALVTCAARAPDNDAMTFLAAAGREAIVVERALHEDFFGRFCLTADGVAAHQPSPTCTGYVATLLQAAAFAPFEVAVAALIPCFRIYEEVGRHQMAEAAPDHPYQAWIDTYADPAFVEAVRGIEALADRLAAGASADTRTAMLAVYERGSRFEWLFWDAAWRTEGWPP